MTIDNATLVEAGLNLMTQNGKRLERQPTKSRTMRYLTPDKETVRIRTSKTQALMVLAESERADAPMNIEGTKNLLFVTPHPGGHIEAYLLPTRIVVQEIRSNHTRWMAEHPNSKNTTRVLYFRPHKRYANYAERWGHYRLKGNISPAPHTAQATPLSVQHMLEQARSTIAQAHDLPVDAVKISVNITL